MSLYFSTKKRLCTIIENKEFNPYKVNPFTLKLNELEGLDEKDLVLVYKAYSLFLLRLDALDSLLPDTHIVYNTVLNLLKTTYDSSTDDTKNAVKRIVLSTIARIEKGETFFNPFQVVNKHMSKGDLLNTALPHYDIFSFLGIYPS